MKLIFTCHEVHPVWKQLSWQRDMKSKLTCSLYHSVAVGRGRFRSRIFDYGKVGSPVCRFCGSENETENHIFFSCAKLLEHQDILRLECKNLNLQFNLQNLLTKPALQRKVEEFLYSVFKSDQFFFS